MNISPPVTTFTIVNNHASPFGPCCICERDDDTVTYLILLDQKAPIPGTGWGCAACGLPPDGAMAVICEACTKANQVRVGQFGTNLPPLRFVINGYAASRQRAAITACTGDHIHDYSKHPEVSLGSA